MNRTDTSVIATKPAVWGGAWVEWLSSKGKEWQEKTRQRPAGAARAVHSWEIKKLSIAVLTNVRVISELLSRRKTRCRSVLLHSLGLDCPKGKPHPSRHGEFERAVTHIVCLIVLCWNSLICISWAFKLQCVRLAYELHFYLFNVCRFWSLISVSLLPVSCIAEWLQSLNFSFSSYKAVIII